MSEIELNCEMDPESRQSLIDLLFGGIVERMPQAVIETDAATYTYEKPLVRQGISGTYSIEGAPGSRISAEFPNGARTVFYVPEREFLDLFSPR